MTDSRDFPASERPEFGVHAPTRAPRQDGDPERCQFCKLRERDHEPGDYHRTLLHCRPAQYCAACARADGKLTRCDGANNTSSEWRAVSKFLLLTQRNGVNYCDREGTH